MVKNRHFLLVEDNVDLATLALRIFKKNNLLTRLTVVAGGQDALDLLMKMADTSASACESFPSLVLLDLNMPQMDGYETLKRIRQSPQIKNVPVVILTTSEDPEDIDTCYGLGVNAYIFKPTEYEALEKTILLIEAYWGRYNMPPPICFWSGRP